MSKRLEQFYEDRELRDSARAVLKSDIEHIRQSLSGKGMASRVADRIGEGALDVFEVAKTQADDKRGIIAILLGAIMLWVTRNPILEVFGIIETEDAESDQEILSTQETQAEEEIDTSGDEPEGGEDDEHAND